MRGAKAKIPVFGILKRGGKVYTKVIADARSDTLVPIIKDKVIPDSVVYSDSFKAYNTLVVSGFKHMRINHSKELANKENHMNGIENFWSQAKRHMRKFNGIPRDNFVLYLKECEWQFNYSDLKSQQRQLTMWIKQYLD